MLIEPSDVEKKSLEAHVELCAERYRFLEHQLTEVKSAVAAVKETIVKTHEMVSKLSEKNNDRMIHWGIGIIAFLITTIGYLLANYVIK